MQSIAIGSGRPRFRPPSRETVRDAAVGVAFAVGLLATQTSIGTESGLTPEVRGLALLLAVGCVALPFRVSIVVFGLYLGLLEGYVKLSSSSELATASRDLLLLLIVAGWAVRAIVHRTRVALPPWTLLVAIYAGVVLVMALHPDTPGVKGLIGGVRQHLGFMPLFFVGFALLRTPRAYRMFAALLIVAVVGNAVVGLVQYSLTPEQLSAWGPGYADLIQGTGGFEGGSRVFEDEQGERRVRPPALGSDQGAGGVFGWIALPFALALVVVGRRGWKATGVIGLAACVVAILTSQSRLALLAGVIGLAAFGALIARRREVASVAIVAVVAAATIAIAVGAFTANQGDGSLSRFQTLAPGELATTVRDDRAGSIALAAEYAFDYPVGVGLARSGPASGFAGSPANIDAENQATFMIGELGTVGFAIFLALVLTVLAAALRVNRRIADNETRLMFGALTAVLLTAAFVGLGAAVTASAPAGPFVWMAAGGVAFMTTRPRDAEAYR